MSYEVPWEQGVGLVLPERVTLDVDGSTFTQASSIAGVPVPQNNSGLVVTATGDAPTAPIQLRTQLGGHAGVDAGSSFVWREVGGVTWYGFDEPSSVHDHLTLSGSFIVNTAAAVPIDAIGLSDGAALCAVFRENVELGPNTFKMSVRRVEPDGTVVQGTVFDFGVKPSIFQGCLVQLQNGRVLLFTAIPDTGSTTTQVRADYSDDGGKTWANASTAVLPVAIRNAGSDYAVSRMSAAAVDSTISMVVTTIRAESAVTLYRDVVIQYASRDGGSSFSEVYRSTEASTITGLKQTADVCVTATSSANILAMWVGEDGFPYRRILGSPYDPIDAETPVIVDSLLGIAAAGMEDKTGNLLATTTMEDGRIAAYFATIPTFARAMRLAVSTDGGASFEPASLGRDGYGLFGELDSAVATNFMLSPRLFPLAGRLGLMYSRQLEFDASVALLGKNTDITLPRYYTGSRRTQQVAWSRAWWGYKPAEFEHVFQFAGDTATGAATADGWQITGAPGELQYREDMTDDETEASVYDDGMLRRYVVGVSVGGSLAADQAAVRFRISKGSGTGRDIVIRHTTTGYRVFDYNAGGGTGEAVGTDVSGITAGAQIEVMVEAHGPEWRVWYRLYTFAGETRWVLSHDFTAASSAAASTASIVWGQIASSTTTSTWRNAGTAYGTWVGVGLSDPIVNPRDLHGRAWSPRAQVLTASGTKVRAVGVTVRGDEWRLDGDSDVRIQNAFIGGPRVGWEATDDSAQTLLLDLSSHNAITSGDMLILSGFDANVGYIQVIGVAYDGGETALFDGALTAGMDGLHFTANGDRVRPATDAQGANRPTLAEDELTGSQWSHYSGSVWRSFVITGNRVGRWTSAATARAAAFVDGEFLAGVSGTDGRIVPKDWALQISMRGAEYKTIKVVIPAPNTTTIPRPAGGRWKIGRLHVGYATSYVYRPSWGDRVTYEPVEEVVEARDGQRTGVELAPVRRRINIGWVDGTSTYALAQRTAGRMDGDAPYYGIDAGADPIGLAGMEQMTLVGVLRRTRGAREMVYLADMQPSQTFVYNRRDQVMLCYLDSDIARERFAGTTLSGDAVRGDVVELLEAT